MKEKIIFVVTLILAPPILMIVIYSVIHAIYWGHLPSLH